MQISYKLIEYRKSLVLLRNIAVVTLVSSIILFLILNIYFEHKSVILGVTFIIGFLVLLALRIYFPTDEIGKICFRDEQIEATIHDNLTLIPYEEIKNITLIFYGHEMQLKRNWSIFSKDLFPYELGHNNQLIITLNSSFKKKYRIFLFHNRETEWLLERLNSASRKYNFSIINK